jgi:hypothetical protein
MQSRDILDQTNYGIETMNQTSPKLQALQIVEGGAIF